MAHIQKIKLKHGTAHQVFYYENGVRKTKYFPPNIPFKIVKQEAYRIAVKNDYAKTGLNEPVDPPTLKQLQEIYIERRQNEIDTTRAQFALIAARKFFGDIITIDKIDHNKIHAFRDWLLQERLPSEVHFNIEQKIRRGVNKELKELRVIFNWAYRKELTPLKTFDKVDFLDAFQPNPNIFTDHEARLIYKNLPRSNIRLIYWIVRLTGMRRGECLALRRRDIDMKQRTIHLQITKNKKSYDYPIPPKLYRIFKWIKIDQGDPEEKLFPYTGDWVSHAFTAARRKAGIKKAGSLHAFRHTYVTKIIKQTKNIYLAQKAARHSSISTTKQYEHLDLEDIRDELSKIDF